MELVSIYTESQGQFIALRSIYLKSARHARDPLRSVALLPSRDAIHNRQFVSSILSMNLMLCKYYGLQK